MFTPECNSAIQNNSNIRLYNRNIPSHTLQPYLDVRPVMTKYSIMPIVDPRKKCNIPLIQQPDYDTNQVFNPGNTQSPWSGFMNNINVESELRNQIFALQKCSQAVYVPNSNSDLYKYNYNPPNNFKINKELAPFKGLFTPEHFNSFNPNPENIGGNMFNNCTRQQIKDLTGKPKMNCTAYN